jgi:diacylglycerol kinase (ATP)
MRKKLQNIRPSWRAVVLLWREEYSFRVQVVCAAAVVLLSFLLHISRMQFLVVVLVIGAVFAVEALNTALEELCDHVMPDQHPQIARVKDLGSGASLLIGIAAVVIGLLIFVPALLSL